MNFNLPDETKMIQDTVRRFVDNELIPLEQEFPDRANSADLPDDIQGPLIKKVEQLGLAAMDAPEEIGGAGLGLLDSCIVTATHCASMYLLGDNATIKQSQSRSAYLFRSIHSRQT